MTSQKITSIGTMTTDSEFCFTQLENELHRNFAESVCSNFFIQNDLLQHLDAFCARSSDTPIVILGEAGSGKSALLANWVRSRHDVAHDDEHIFYHAIGCSRLSSHVSHLLRRLENWLLKQFDLKDDMDLSSDDQLPWILPRLLDRASKRGTCVIVLDGLQHITESGLRWLPTKLPSNIHMILSSSSSSDHDHGDVYESKTSEHSRKQQVKTQQICDEITRRNWPVLLMDPLSEESVRAIATKHTSIYCVDAIIDDLCSHPNASNPSFLTGVLRGVSSLSTDRDSMKQYFSCENTTQLIEHTLAQVQGHSLGNSLSLLFVARHGLHEDELFDLLGGMVSNNEAPSLCDEDKELLFDELCFLGVVRLDTKFGRLLTLPLNNPTLRHVIWNKCITTARETEVRSLFVEYFQKKDPSLRYCEEFPWQQERNQCPNLGQTLVDLRVLDIMYNTEELRNELFSFLSQLVLSNNFDIVSRFNEALQKWTVKQKPTSTQISMMTVFLGDVMRWFSKKASEYYEMPQFMRDNIQVNHLLLSDPAGVLLSTASATLESQRQSAEHYYYHRWLWCNWPWIALRAASQKLQDEAAADPTSFNVSAVKKGGEEDGVALERTVRETHTALPKSLLTKLDKLTSGNFKTQQKTSTASVIPFSTNRFAQDAPRPTHIESPEQKIRDAKKVLDAFKIEKSKRESRLQTMQADNKLASTALINSRQQQEHGDSMVLELNSRYAKVKSLMEKAVSIESSFTDVVVALDTNDPAISRHHETLEHEIDLKNQELKNLQNESKVNVEHAEQARKASQSIKSLIKSTEEKRTEIEPLLTSLRTQAEELEELRKSALHKKFDSAAFSKRVQLVGKIAKRRQDAKQKHIAAVSQATVGALINHPMIRLIETSGTKDAEEIVTKMHRDEEESEMLRTRQESVEFQLKDRRSRLDQLLREMEELGLVDSFSGSGHDSPSTMQIECTELQRRQHQLAVISNLTANISISLLHMHQKAQQLIHNDQTLSIHGIMNKGDSNLFEDAKSVTSVVKDLCKDFVVLPSSASPTNETPSKYNNVRVLNKAEAESQFTDFK